MRSKTTALFGRCNYSNKWQDRGQLLGFVNTQFTVKCQVLHFSFLFCPGLWMGACKKWPSQIVFGCWEFMNMFYWITCIRFRIIQIEGCIFVKGVLLTRLISSLFPYWPDKINSKLKFKIQDNLSLTWRSLFWQSFPATSWTIYSFDSVFQTLIWHSMLA